MIKTNETMNLGAGETNPLKGVISEELFTEFGRVLSPMICEKNASKLFSDGKQAARMLVDVMDSVDGSKDGQIERKTLAHLITELGKIDSNIQAGIGHTQILQNLPERVSASDLNRMLELSIAGDPQGFIKTLRQVQAIADCKNGPAEPMATPAIVESSTAVRER